MNSHTCRPLEKADSRSVAAASSLSHADWRYLQQRFVHAVEFNDAAMLRRLLFGEGKGRAAKRGVHGDGREVVDPTPTTPPPPMHVDGSHAPPPMHHTSDGQGDEKSPSASVQQVPSPALLLLRLLRSSPPLRRALVLSTRFSRVASDDVTANPNQQLVGAALPTTADGSNNVTTEIDDEDTHHFLNHTANGASAGGGDGARGRDKDDALSAERAMRYYDHFNQQGHGGDADNHQHACGGCGCDDSTLLPPPPPPPRFAEDWRRFPYNGLHVAVMNGNVAMAEALRSAVLSDGDDDDGDADNTGAAAPHAGGRLLFAQWVNRMSFMNWTTEVSPVTAANTSEENNEDPSSSPRDGSDPPHQCPSLPPPPLPLMALQTNSAEMLEWVLANAIIAHHHLYLPPSPPPAAAGDDYDAVASEVDSSHAAIPNHNSMNNPIDAPMDGNGRSLLHMAVGGVMTEEREAASRRRRDVSLFVRMPVIVLLLRLGADVSARDDSGLTPLGALVWGLVELLEGQLRSRAGPVANGHGGDGATTATTSSLMRMMMGGTSTAAVSGGSGGDVDVLDLFSRLTMEPAAAVFPSNDRGSERLSAPFSAAYIHRAPLLVGLLLEHGATAEGGRETSGCASSSASFSLPADISLDAILEREVDVLMLRMMGGEGIGDDDDNPSASGGGADDRRHRWDVAVRNMAVAGVGFTFVLNVVASAVREEAARVAAATAVARLEQLRGSRGGGEENEEPSVDFISTATTTTTAAAVHRRVVFDPSVSDNTGKPRPLSHRSKEMRSINNSLLSSAGRALRPSSTFLPQTAALPLLVPATVLAANGVHTSNNGRSNPTTTVLPSSANAAANANANATAAMYHASSYTATNGVGGAANHRTAERSRMRQAIDLFNRKLIARDAERQQQQQQQQSQREQQALTTMIAEASPPRNVVDAPREDSLSAEGTVSPLGTPMGAAPPSSAVAATVAGAGEFPVPIAPPRRNSTLMGAGVVMVLPTAAAAGTQQRQPSRLQELATAPSLRPLSATTMGAPPPSPSFVGAGSTITAGAGVLGGGGLSLGAGGLLGPRSSSPSTSSSSSAEEDISFSSQRRFKQLRTDPMMMTPTGGGGPPSSTVHGQQGTTPQTRQQQSIVCANIKAGPVTSSAEGGGGQPAVHNRLHHQHQHGGSGVGGFSSSAVVGLFSTPLLIPPSTPSSFLFAPTSAAAILGTAPPRTPPSSSSRKKQRHNTGDKASKREKKEKRKGSSSERKSKSRRHDHSNCGSGTATTTVTSAEVPTTSIAGTLPTCGGGGDRTLEGVMSRAEIESDEPSPPSSAYLLLDLGRTFAPSPPPNATTATATTEPSSSDSASGSRCSTASDK